MSAQDPGIGPERAERDRLLAAMRELAATHGPRGVTAAEVCDRSGATSGAFIAHFSDVDELFAAVVEQELAALVAAVEHAALTAEGPWEEKVRAALGAFFGTLDADPSTAWLCVVEPMGADRRLSAARTAASERIAAQLRPPDDAAITEGGPPVAAAPMLVGGLWELAYQQLTGHGATASLVDLVGPATFLVLAPHVGAASARAYAEDRA